MPATSEPNLAKPKSPFPWRADTEYDDTAVDRDGNSVFHIGDLSPAGREVRDLIVTRVNAHDELVSALRGWVEHFDRLDEDSDPFDRLAKARRDYHRGRVEASRAALAKADGRQS